VKEFVFPQVGFGSCCASCAQGLPCEGTKKSKKACCASCAEGRSCEGGAPCSQPKPTPSVPGSTSFPVGFGQSSVGPIATQNPALAAVSAWVFPLTVGAIGLAAGMGLAFYLNRGRS